MKNSTNRLIGLSTLVIVIGSGCASNGQTIVRAPASQKLSTFKNVTIEVAALDEDDQEDAKQLQEVTLAKLQARNLFKRAIASTPKSNSELHVKVRVTDVRHVSTFGRVMFGAFAGQGSVSADIDLINVKTKRTIASFSAEGKTSGGSVAAGTTPEAIDRVAEQIVEFIQKNM